MLKMLRSICTTRHYFWKRQEECYMVEWATRSTELGFRLSLMGDKCALSIESAGRIPAYRRGCADRAFSFGLINEVTSSGNQR
jgi:hypothetical protein